MPTDYYCYECEDQHMYRCPREIRRERGLTPR